MGAVKQLEPHQQRVLKEAEELQERYSKLDTFLNQGNSTIVSIVGNEEFVRLIRQRRAMHEYLTVLNERIAAFNKE